MGQNSGRGWNRSQGRCGFTGNGGFTGVFPGFGRRGGRGFIICQICFKHNPYAAECRDKFNRNFVLNFPVNGHYPNQNQASIAAYMVTSEGIADQGWYLTVEQLIIL